MPVPKSSPSLGNAKAKPAAAKKAAAKSAVFFANNPNSKQQSKNSTAKEQPDENNISYQSWLVCLGRCVTNVDSYESALLEDMMHWGRGRSVESFEQFLRPIRTLFRSHREIGAQQEQIIDIEYLKIAITNGKCHQVFTTRFCPRLMEFHSKKGGIAENILKENQMALDYIQSKFSSNTLEGTEVVAKIWYKWHRNIIDVHYNDYCRVFANLRLEKQLPVGPIPPFKKQNIVPDCLMELVDTSLSAYVKCLAGRDKDFARLERVFTSWEVDGERCSPSTQYVVKSALVNFRTKGQKNVDDAGMDAESELYRLPKTRGELLSVMDNVIQKKAQASTEQRYIQAAASPTAESRAQKLQEIAKQDTWETFYSCYVRLVLKKELTQARRRASQGEQKQPKGNGGNHLTIEDFHQLYDDMYSGGFDPVILSDPGYSTFCSSLSTYRGVHFSSMDTRQERDQRVKGLVLNQIGLEQERITGYFQSMCSAILSNGCAQDSHISGTQQIKNSMALTPVGRAWRLVLECSLAILYVLKHPSYDAVKGLVSRYANNWQIFTTEQILGELLSVLAKIVDRIPSSIPEYGSENYNKWYSNEIRAHQVLASIPLVQNFLMDMDPLGSRVTSIIMGLNIGESSSSSHNLVDIQKQQHDADLQKQLDVITGLGASSGAKNDDPSSSSTEPPALKSSPTLSNVSDVITADPTSTTNSSNSSPNVDSSSSKTPQIDQSSLLAAKTAPEQPVTVSASPSASKDLPLDVVNSLINTVNMPDSLVALLKNYANSTLASGSGTGSAQVVGSNGGMPNNASSNLNNINIDSESASGSGSENFKSNLALNKGQVESSASDGKLGLSNMNLESESGLTGCGFNNKLNNLNVAAALASNNNINIGLGSASGSGSDNSKLNLTLNKGQGESDASDDKLGLSDMNLKSESGLNGSEINNKLNNLNVTAAAAVSESAAAEVTVKVASESGNVHHNVEVVGKSTRSPEEELIMQQILADQLSLSNLNNLNGLKLIKTPAGSAVNESQEAVCDSQSQIGLGMVDSSSNVTVTVESGSNLNNKIPEQVAAAVGVEVADNIGGGAAAAAEQLPVAAAGVIGNNINKENTATESESVSNSIKQVTVTNNVNNVNGPGNSDLGLGGASSIAPNSLNNIVEKAGKIGLNDITAANIGDVVAEMLASAQKVPSGDLNNVTQVQNQILAIQAALKTQQATEDGGSTNNVTAGAAVADLGLNLVANGGGPKLNNVEQTVAVGKSDSNGQKESESAIQSESAIGQHIGAGVLANAAELPKVAESASININTCHSAAAVTKAPASESDNAKNIAVSKSEELIMAQILSDQPKLNNLNNLNGLTAPESQVLAVTGSQSEVKPQPDNSNNVTVTVESDSNLNNKIPEQVAAAVGVEVADNIGGGAAAAAEQVPVAAAGVIGDNINKENTVTESESVSNSIKQDAVTDNVNNVNGPGNSDLGLGGASSIAPNSLNNIVEKAGKIGLNDITAANIGDVVAEMLASAQTVPSGDLNNVTQVQNQILAIQAALKTQQATEDGGSTNNATAGAAVADLGLNLVANGGGPKLNNVEQTVTVGKSDSNGQRESESESAIKSESAIGQHIGAGVLANAAELPKVAEAASININNILSGSESQSQGLVIGGVGDSQSLGSPVIPSDYDADSQGGLMALDLPLRRLGGQGSGGLLLSDVNQGGLPLGSLDSQGVDLEAQIASQQLDLSGYNKHLEQLGQDEEGPAAKRQKQ